MAALANRNVPFQSFPTSDGSPADLRCNVMLMSLGLNQAKYLLSSVSPR